MQKIVDSKAIIHFFYDAIKRKPIIDERTIQKANILIDKFNKRIPMKGDRHISDYIKSIKTIDDFNKWKNVFTCAEKALHNIVDEKFIRNIMANENYIKESMRVHLSPSRYYEREKTVYTVIVRYIYFFDVIFLKDSQKDES